MPKAEKQQSAGSAFPQTTGTDRTMTNDKAPLLIKRYASRRLYNTETSDYITLQQIADCIRSGRDVQIVDLKSGEDLTRQYLIQIIADHESRGEHVFPLSVLMEVVRAYNDQGAPFSRRFIRDHA